VAGRGAGSRPRGEPIRVTDTRRTTRFRASRFDAVLVDFDGTLVDSEPVHLASWMEVLPKYGVRTHADQFARRFIGVPAPAEAAILVAEHRLSLTPAALVEEKEAVFRRLLAERGIPLMPGARDALDLLAGTGLALGLVTGSPRFIVEPVLARHALTHLFQAVVTFDEAPRSKPAPDCYQKAVELLGADATRGVALEDSENGIASAKNAGLVCIAVCQTWSRLQDLSRADRLTDDLAEAAAAILAWH
jgi:HAD superfamily hydrolase (TIGR01509 family)